MKTTKSKTSKSQAKKQIVLGHVYSVAVGGSYLSVRVDKSLGHGRYEGMSVRLDSPSPGSAVKFTTDRVRGDGVQEAEWQKRAVKPAEQPTQPIQKAKAADVGPGAKTRIKPTHDATPARKRPTREPGATSRRPSGLDAAAKVLADAGEPLNTKTMVERMLAKGLWKTGGKTPAATIYAAIIREIAVKGSKARFRKTERGKFELVK